MKTLIVFAFILLLPLTTSLNVTLEYPSEVELNEEIIFKISTDGTVTYDVKIDPLNLEGKRVARIFNSGVWKSTMYYVPASLNSVQEYKLIFQEYTGKANITIKLRDSSGNTETFEGYEIEIKSSQQSISVENSEENLEDSPEINSTQEEKDLDNSEIKITNFEKIEGDTSQKNIINLTPQTIKSNISSEEDRPLNKMYYVLSFGLLLCLLFLIDKNKKLKKNEFN